MPPEQKYNISEKDRQPLPRLEPLSLGEIIDRTLDLYFKNFKDYIISSLIINGPASIIFFIVALVLIYFTHEKDEVGVAVFYIFFIFITTLVNVIFTGVVTILTAEYYQGRRMGFREAIKKFWKVLPGYAFTMVMMSLWLGILSALFFLAFFVGSSATDNPLVGFILCLLPLFALLYYVFCFFLTPQVVILENITGYKALMRSKELVTSSRKSTMTVVMVPYLINLFTVIMTTIPMVGYLVMLLLYSMPMMAVTIAYFDIRIRREGYDMLARVEGLEAEDGEALISSEKSG